MSAASTENSHPGPGRPTPPAQSDELFDELDSLLQRMLALPVNQTEGDEGAAPAAEDAEDDLPPDLPLITVAEAGIDALPEPLAPMSVSQEPFYQPPDDLFGAPPSRPAATAPPPPVTLRAEAPPTSPPPVPAETRQVAPSSTSMAPAAAADEPSLSGPGILVWCNRAYDSVTAPLGPLGRWLRGDSGRQLVGLAGVGLMLTAVGLVARDWFGWTW